MQMTDQGNIPIAALSLLIVVAVCDKLRQDFQKRKEPPPEKPGSKLDITV